jgi:hypothetical protein
MPHKPMSAGEKGAVDEWAVAGRAAERAGKERREGFFIELLIVYRIFSV